MKVGESLKLMPGESSRCGNNQNSTHQSDGEKKIVATNLFYFSY